MNPVHATVAMILERQRTRPPSYFQEIESAVIERLADGSAIYDQDHPAWRLAQYKYAPRPALTGYDPDTSPESPRVGGCCDPPRRE